MHNRIAVRAAENEQRRVIVRTLNALIFQDRETDAVINDYLTTEQTLVAFDVTEYRDYADAQIFHRELQALWPQWNRDHDLAMITLLTAIMPEPRRARLIIEMEHWAAVEIQMQAARLNAGARRVARQDERPLARFANDKQNVHTEPITKQLNDGMSILLAIEVPREQKSTMYEIGCEFQKMEKDRHQVDGVLRDMLMWWNMTSVMKTNDLLYRKLLRGLWWTIKNTKDKETQKELTNRLWEECLDSVKMCAQGHLARLTNVMIGYDESIKAPVPVGEILQAKLSAIQASDAEWEEQVCQAKAVLVELEIPADQHMVWLEAF